MTQSLKVMSLWRRYFSCNILTDDCTVRIYVRSIPYVKYRITGELVQSRFIPRRQNWCSMFSTSSEQIIWNYESVGKLWYRNLSAAVSAQTIYIDVYWLLPNMVVQTNSAGDTYTRDRVAAAHDWLTVDVLPASLMHNITL